MEMLLLGEMPKMAGFGPVGGLPIEVWNPRRRTTGNMPLNKAFRKLLEFRFALMGGEDAKEKVCLLQWCSNITKPGVDHLPMSLYSCYGLFYQC
jgi:hypothetical protein